MKRLWSHQDGRLRVGMVSVGLFGLLLLAAGLVMQLSRPVGQVMVKVDHFFAAQPPAADLPSEKPAAQPGEAVDGQTAAEIASETAHVDAGAPPKGEPAAMEGGTELQPPDEEAQATAEAKPPMAVESQAAARRQNAPTPAEAPVVKSGEAAEEVVKTEELVVVEPVAVAESEPSTLATVPPARQAASAAEEARPEAFEAVQQVIPAAADAPTASVTVTPKQYRALFQSWHTAPPGTVDDPARPGLLVENLRQVYPYFQMKPVAMARGVAYDLEDGSRLAEGALERYAGTVFRVASPWQDWSKELKQIGLNPTDTFEVRYYMHGYVHNGIYGRSSMAIDWCHRQGLLAAGITAGQIEVRGRAFAVKQQGGGRFGVFVPQTLRLADGRSIAIDPAAFGEAADIALLRNAGLL